MSAQLIPDISQELLTLSTLLDLLLLMLAKSKSDKRHLD